MFFFFNLHPKVNVFLFSDVPCSCICTCRLVTMQTVQQTWVTKKTLFVWMHSPHGVAWKISVCHKWCRSWCAVLCWDMAEMYSIVQSAHMSSCDEHKYKVVQLCVQPASPLWVSWHFVASLFRQYNWLFSCSCTVQCSSLYGFNSFNLLPRYLSYLKRHEITGRRMSWMWPHYNCHCCEPLQMMWKVIYINVYIFFLCTFRSNWLADDVR